VTILLPLHLIERDDQILDVVLSCQKAVFLHSIEAKTMLDDIANLIPIVKVHEQGKRSGQTSSCIPCSFWVCTSQSDTEATSMTNHRLVRRATNDTSTWCDWEMNVTTRTKLYGQLAYACNTLHQ
jgi:hypothetical protein